MSTNLDEEEQLKTLNSLLEASKTPSGRARLTGSGAVSATLRRLSSSPASSPLTLPSLRLLRNLCAGEISNQDAFVHSAGPQTLLSLLLSPPSPEVIRAGIQVLGNVALAGEEHHAAVWSRFFPDGLVELARVRERGVCDPLCMLIDTCCSSIGGETRLDELCGTETGIQILAEIITTASQVGYGEEWLEWLLFKTCVEQQKFSLIFPSLISPNQNNNPNLSFTDEINPKYFNSNHSFLLGLLSKCLTERPKEVSISNKFALDILNLVKINCKIVDFTTRNNSAVPTGSPTIDILGYSLILLRDICAWENELNDENPINLLLNNGLLDLVLNLLNELEPPSIIKKSMINQPNNSSEKIKNVCVYKGYRRDIVSIIANCLHNRKRVQDEIRERNMINLLLQQCVLDEENPYLREWGLLAVRNLLEGNEENMKEVSELELKEAVTTSEIKELGFKVEVDEVSKRAKLVNI
ncbi:hypothetical protein LUZ60_014664 [Juncus effusus]|nr:hypothetical protein LUZ60_014664 [Juncus effusus]